MIKDPSIHSRPLKEQRKRAIARIAILTPMLENERRMPSVLRHIRAELLEHQKDLAELNLLIEPKTHHQRPSFIKRGGNWVCYYCKTLNLYEDSECKMILVDKRKKETAVDRNSPRHPEFWDFLEGE